MSAYAECTKCENIFLTEDEASTLGECGQCQECVACGEFKQDLNEDLECPDCIPEIPPMDSKGNCPKCRDYARDCKC